MSGLPPMSLRVRVAARSLLLQSCWNEEGMQNVGFAFALKPWLKRIEREGGPPEAEAVRRHLQYFNTQPYMASFVLGVAGRLEEGLAAEAPEALAAAYARIRSPAPGSSWSNRAQLTSGSVPTSRVWAGPPGADSKNTR